MTREKLAADAAYQHGFAPVGVDDPLRDFMATYFEQDDNNTREQVIDFLERIVRAALDAPAQPVHPEPLSWPAEVNEWIEVAQGAIDRGGRVDWDDSRHVAEDVATQLWNYLSLGLIPSPQQVREASEPEGAKE